MSNVESLMRLRKASSREKAAVFIHGIGAKDPQEYWKQFTAILLQDTNAFIRDFDVYIWGYPTHKGPRWLVDFIRSLFRSFNSRESHMPTARACLSSHADTRPL